MGHSAVIVTCVVQARVGSSRFPGKVLADLDGVPVLAFMLRRLAPLVGAEVDHLVVATSEAPGDGEVAALGAAEGAEVVRGPEADVLGRFAGALDRVPGDLVVRLTGDCPLADPRVVARAVAEARRGGADYVSNTLVRTYPDGLDVEVCRGDTLRAAAAEARDPVEREHVTPFVYRRPERFALRSFRHDGPPVGHVRWTVDTPADLDAVRALVARVGRPDFSWEEALAVAGPRADSRTGDVLVLVAAGRDDSAFLLDLRNEAESVRWSRTARRVEADEHADWFEARLDDPAHRIWVARRGAQRVGQVRVDVCGGVGTVSIGVVPSERGRGVAREMLAALERALSADHQVHTLVAEVHRDNGASLRLFRAAGFASAGRTGDFVRLRRVRDRHVETA